VVFPFGSKTLQALLGEAGADQEWLRKVLCLRWKRARGERRQSFFLYWRGHRRIIQTKKGGEEEVDEG